MSGLFPVSSHACRELVAYTERILWGLSHEFRHWGGSERVRKSPQSPSHAACDVILQVRLIFLLFGCNFDKYLWISMLQFDALQLDQSNPTSHRIAAPLCDRS